MFGQFPINPILAQAAAGGMAAERAHIDRSKAERKAVSKGPGSVRTVADSVEIVVSGPQAVEAVHAADDQTLGNGANQRKKRRLILGKRVDGTQPGGLEPGHLDVQG